MDGEPPPSLRRRNSIPIPSSAAMAPPNGTVFPPPPPSPIDLRLVSFKSSQSYTSLKSSQSYTSLKDILPSSATAAVNSPTDVSAANSGHEILIRNRLVKQAAWAYLQPMSASSCSAGPDFFHRICLRLSTANPIADCLGFIRGSLIPAIVRVFRRCICL